MDKKSEDATIFEQIKELEKVDPKVLEAFKQAMTEEVIPKAAEAVEERRLKAVESAQWQLKC
jgi:hypothetical protein